MRKRKIYDEESEEIFKVVLRAAGTDVRYNVREWRHDTFLKYLKTKDLSHNG